MGNPFVSTGELILMLVAFVFLVKMIWLLHTE